jgi:hypothetical protein
MMARKNNGAVYAMIALIGVLSALYVVLIVTGHAADIESFTSFILVVLPLALGYVGLSARLDNVQRTNEEANVGIGEIRTRVNGELSAQFDRIHERLDGLGQAPSE